MWAAPPSNPGAPVFTPPAAHAPTDADVKRAESYAKIALGVAIASLFVAGPILGPIGIVMGAKSIKRGQGKLGGWAIAAGAAGTILSIVLIVLSALGVLPTFDEMWNRMGE